MSLLDDLNRLNSDREAVQVAQAELLAVVKQSKESMDSALLEQIKSYQSQDLTAPQQAMPKPPHGRVVSGALGGLEGLFAHIAGGPQAVAQVNQNITSQQMQLAQQAHQVATQNLQAKATQRLNELARQESITNIQLARVKNAQSTDIAMAELKLDSARGDAKYNSDVAGANSDAATKLTQQYADRLQRFQLTDKYDRMSDTITAIGTNELYKPDPMNPGMTSRQPATDEEIAEATREMTTLINNMLPTIGKDNVDALLGNVESALRANESFNNARAAAEEEVAKQKRLDDKFGGPVLDGNPPLLGPGPLLATQEAVSQIADFFRSLGSYDEPDSVNADPGPLNRVGSGLQRSGQGILKGLQRAIQSNNPDVIEQLSKVEAAKDQVLK